VINDLLDPTGQNLRVREDAQVLCLAFMDLLKKLCELSYHEKNYYLMDLIYWFINTCTKFSRAPMLRV
jgi:hypothetical protein